ncbi:MAG: radical SAM protein [Promethearchaeota archaeon]
MQLPMPTSCAFAITYKCNSRCSMCNIWQKYEKDPQASQKEIRSDQFFAFVKKWPTITSYNIVGGEPFLSPYIEDAAMFLLVNEKNFTITTNGVLTAKISNFVERLTNFPQQYGISISLDALRELHDRMRGRRNFYERAMQTIEQLIQARENGSNIRLSIHFTLTPLNFNQLWPIYELAKELKLGFRFNFMAYSDFYFENKDKSMKFTETKFNTIEHQINKIIFDEQNGKTNDKLEKRHAHFRAMLAYEKDHAKNMFCTAYKTHMYLDPFGVIYPCCFLNKKVGTINDTPEVVWANEELKEFIRHDCKCNVCPHWLESVMDVLIS